MAPAGNYESFLGAIHAGADAVYLGGIKFGARAFADNFDEEALIRAIYYAHLFDKKVYMTLNTLMKQSELMEVDSFIEPFYLAGLDGVIVQDLGLLKYLKEHYPLLELHISTQMAVTGPYSARMLKESGACRVVPARELSLDEIKLLKKEEIDVETFIHGAMCYSYSGQCFFSSLLGGRSGNRGKCAQSCRLPYQVNLSDKKKEKGKKEEYPLSLKDLCSVNLLPELLEAGIDSLKIEGRMKRPEYAAGVTAIYRKYIDLYYKKGSRGFKVEKEDMDKLSSLYIRSEIQDGYYHKHNGKDMVTLTKPGYGKMDDGFASELYEKYINTSMKAPVSGSLILYKGQPAILTLEYKDIFIQCEQGEVQEASKRPMVKADIIKQIQKTGNTDFKFTSIDVIMEDDIFIPNKQLNELRREAFVKLEQEIKSQIKEKRQLSLKNKSSINIISKEECCNTERKKKLIVSVDSLEQWKEVALLSGIQRVYIPGELFVEKDKSGKNFLEDIKNMNTATELWVKFPLILRKKSFSYVNNLLEAVKDKVSGILVSNLEGYSYLKYSGYKGKIALNYHMYLWNREALNFWKSRADAFLAPMECNYREWKKLEDPGFEYLCYGKLPMMVTANCIRLTKDACRGVGISFEDSITDRYQTNFRVQTNCYHCYNVIYNSVPTSLHTHMEQIEALPGEGIRLDFTTETSDETRIVLKEYIKYMNGEKMDFSFLKDYTTGHFKKGAL